MSMHLQAAAATLATGQDAIVDPQAEPGGTDRVTCPSPSPDVRSRLALRAGFDADITRQLIELLGRRWTLQILAELSGGPLRRSRLRDRIDGCSEKMLTERLRELESAGLVTREYFEGTPPRVDYGLSPRGEKLTRKLARLASWALQGVPAEDWSGRGR